MANPTGQLFYYPQAQPQSAGAPMPLAYLNFYLSGTTTPTPVYQDAAQTLPYPVNSLGQYVVTADGTGTFPVIYLNPQIIYRVQLYNSAGAVQEDQDPVVPSMTSTGNGYIVINSAGEVTITAPSPGGTGVTLTIVPRTGQFALQLQGNSAGNPLIIANDTVTVGSQTATFAATNKPGSATTAPTNWLPIQCDGGTYYMPLWL